MSNIKQSNIERYRSTYSYKELCKKHSMSEIGIWKIRGEDSNCDFGGSHYQPELGLVEGKLEDIIAYAVELPSFWQWGSGGDITKVSPPIKIDAASNAKRVKAEEKVRDLTALLKQAEQELQELQGL